MSGGAIETVAYIPWELCELFFTSEYDLKLSQAVLICGPADVAPAQRRGSTDVPSGTTGTSGPPSQLSHGLLEATIRWQTNAYSLRRNLRGNL